jgi:hypothetical protein
MLKRTSKKSGQIPSPNTNQFFPHAEQVYEQKESNFITAAL